MTNFTDNPLERLMQQKPLPGKRSKKIDIENDDVASVEQPASSLIPLDVASELVAKLQLPGSPSVAKMAQL